MHKYYRFTRNGVMRVLDILTPHLQNKTARSHAIDPQAQVYVALRFYATRSGTNKEFRIKGALMITYWHMKEALSYLYIQQKVGDDGISTSTLEI